MTNEERNKNASKLKVICQHLIQKTSSNSKFVFPSDSDTYFEVLVDKIESIYGSVVPGRILDIAIYIEYSNREQGRRFVGFLTQIPRKYSTTAIDLYSVRKYGMVSYENEWLESYGLSRESLYNLIKDTKEPTFISSSFEDPSRIRFANTVTGFVYCHQHSSGWDPTSKVCPTCIFIDKCKADLKLYYPELYNQREKITT